MYAVCLVGGSPGTQHSHLGNAAAHARVVISVRGDWFLACRRGAHPEVRMGNAERAG